MLQIKTKSGTTSKNEIFERIEDSIITAEKRKSVVIKRDLTIANLLCGRSTVFDLQQLHFQDEKNQLLV